MANKRDKKGKSQKKLIYFFQNTSMAHLFHQKLQQRKPNQRPRMRSTTQRNRYTKETEQKKYCKVCHKAGKSEKEYTSHFTKSVPGDKGIVVCPTILRNLCNKCNKYGHFADFCKEARDFCKEGSRDMRREPMYRDSRKEVPQEKAAPPSYEEMFPAIGEEPSCRKKRTREVTKNTGAYSVLGADSDDEDEVSVRQPMRIAPRTTLNFKKAIEKEVPKPKEEEPTFGGEMTVLSYGRNTGFVKQEPVANDYEPWEYEADEYDEYDNEEYYENQFDMDEVDRRIAERESRMHNYVEDEDW